MFRFSWATLAVLAIVAVAVVSLLSSCALSQEDAALAAEIIRNPQNYAPAQRDALATAVEQWGGGRWFEAVVTAAGAFGLVELRRGSPNKRKGTAPVAA